ncbi:thermosome subunit beta [Promethearchaeum syntrophicum]|uniref:Thermosome subunit beta n=1 Tax=Promethearchaeum syntrophicum TaxID=2594042 RepID=A0A5B9D8U5_9ARCH|nr:thermosome subunit beta [Candidatus Prometheoarchaeum syntrophicum]QEE15431.1 Thermosome subunit alpha [Candidatus Prometheoarchaeum syntrophicum]
MSQLGGQPVLILKEGAERTTGKSAQRNNILAAKTIAEAIRSSLGPRGMDKMLVDSFGDVTITNDGATILKEIDVEHPAAKMLVEVAKAQDEEVGDGTTSSVILAGELLKRAEKLLDQKIHPTVITEGFRKASSKALEILDSMAMPIDPKDKKMLKKAARTSMSSKIISEYSDLVSDIVVDACLAVSEEIDGNIHVDLDRIQIQKKDGAALDETQFISGIILDKEIVNSGMEKRVEEAKILLISSAIEVEKTEFDAKLQITSPDQITAFLDQEQKMLEDLADKIAATGANVVICQKGIDDMAQHFLVKKGISAIRRVKKSDLDKLSKATGATIFSNLDDMNAEGLGYAGIVEERKIMNENWTFIEKCKHPKSVVVFIRGGTELVVDEADRSIHDALSVVKDCIEEPSIVGGGGAPELEVAKELRLYAETLQGREQLAVKVFADSLEIIPKTLAQNAGFDQIEILMKVRAAHGKGLKFAGLDLNSNEVVDDMVEADVIEPVNVKKQAIKSASECAQMILRIDDVIAGVGGGAGGPPGGMPPGMGGMPPGMGGMPPGMM